MKMNWEEYNELQTQMMIRDTAQEVWYKLNYLAEVLSKKDREEIHEYMKYINKIENKAIYEIRNMIEGGNDE